MKSILLSALFAASFFSSSTSSSSSSSPSSHFLRIVETANAKVFNVLDYGAVEDTTANQPLSVAKKNGEVFYHLAMNIANTPPETRDYADNDGYNTILYPKNADNDSVFMYYVPFKPFVGLYRIHFRIEGRLTLPNTNESRATWPTNDLPRPTVRNGKHHQNHHGGDDETDHVDDEGDGFDLRGRFSNPSSAVGKPRQVLHHAAASAISAVSHLRFAAPPSPPAPPLIANTNHQEHHHDFKKRLAALDEAFRQGKERTPLDAFYITNSTGIRFDGGGQIDGGGYPWWWECVLTGIDFRPYLIMMKGVEDIYLGHLELRDSPMYHIFLQDTKTILVEYMTIRVNIWGQTEIQNLARQRTEAAIARLTTAESKGLFGFNSSKKMPLVGDIPMFPLNTDGIDIAGVDVVVRHCVVECFDDALCPKPLNRKSKFGPCSRNHHWYNHSIVWGVGASIGSVPPNPNVNCIADIVIEDVNFTNALKTLYIKPNPCPNPAIDGTGIINNITYKDIISTNPVTWPLWFSTQQQKQPGNGTNTGCSFLYPLPGTTCPVFPCVPITNVHVTNVTIVGGLLSTGVMRCDPSNPCKNFTFTDVVHENGGGFPFGKDAYLCHGLENVRFLGNSFPAKCVDNDAQAFN